MTYPPLKHFSFLAPCPISRPTAASPARVGVPRVQIACNVAPSPSARALNSEERRLTVRPDQVP
jgi:hypothetical protein